MGKLGNKELDNRYEVLKLLDTGGTSQVFLTIDRKLNCQWAIKKTKKRSEAINTVMTEANILKSLNHPALPRIVDIREDNDYFYTVMDFVQGENLRTILRAKGAQNQEQVVQWGIDLCDVMTYLHNNQIIYRDMKPSNIMLTPEGQIKLIDFGIAREYDPTANEDTVALGTEGYAAPEQYSGHGQSDERTDVYGIGVTLFQLLTNVNPATYTENLFSIRMVNPELSSGLDKIILKCTNKSPEKRYQNTEELKEALLNYKLLDNEYLKAEKKQKTRTMILSTLSALCFITGGILLYVDSQQIDNKYQSLLATQKSDKIAEAILLAPERDDGYISLLDSYGEQVDQQEATQFSHLYADHQSEIKDLNSVSMKAGEKLLTSYVEESLRSKLIIAESYFKNVNDKSEQYAAANAYVQLATFYKDFVIQNDGVIVKEANKTEYKTLLDNMTTLINSIKKYNGTEQKNLLLITNELCLNMLNEQMSAMQNQKIEKSEISAVINAIKTSSNSIDPKVDVTKTKQQKVLTLVSTAESLLEDVYNIKKEA